MNRKHLLFSALLVNCLLLSPALIRAQITTEPTKPATETVSGHVVISLDGGPPQRNTRILILDEKSGKQYTAQLDAKGEFGIALPEGFYVVLIASIGFNPYAKEIELERGKPVKLMVKLDPDAPWDSQATCRG